MRHSLCTLALFTLLPFAPLAAHADSFAAGAVRPVALGPSADTFSLNSLTTTTSALPGTLLQTGIFQVGDSGSLDGTFNFNFVDNIIIDGTTKAVQIFGSDHITPAADTLTIFPTGPISIGANTYSLRGFSLTAENIANYSANLTADVTHSTTPEPASLALMGTGALLTAFIARRRAFFAVVGTQPPSS